jgi:hypothetical protein
MLLMHTTHEGHQKINTFVRGLSSSGTETRRYKHRIITRPALTYASQYMRYPIVTAVPKIVLWTMIVVNRLLVCW